MSSLKRQLFLRWDEQERSANSIGSNCLQGGFHLVSRPEPKIAGRFRRDEISDAR